MIHSDCPLQGYALIELLLKACYRIHGYFLSRYQYHCVSDTSEIKNAQFFCSKAEQFLPNYMQGLPTAPVVAVVDPPRGGLRKSIFSPNASARKVSKR